MRSLARPSKDEKSGHREGGKPPLGIGISTTGQEGKCIALSRSRGGKRMVFQEKGIGGKKKIGWSRGQQVTGDPWKGVGFWVKEKRKRRLRGP